MRPICATLVLLTGPAAAQTAGPSPAPGAVDWLGTIHCGTIPGVTSLALHQPLTVTVTGNQAQYHRYVRKADTSVETGYVEQGGGIVAPDGAVTLTGSAVGRGFSYSASYAGRLPPGGGFTRLSGAQQWTGPKINPYRRACFIDLKR